MKETLFISLLYCSLSLTHAQHYTLRRYAAIDGLPQSQVNVMLEDKNGYLWIGTQGGGLAQFDGREFKVYTTIDGLLSNIVSFLKIDTNDNLWIVHPRGITKYDGSFFKRFQQPGRITNIRRLRKIVQHADSLFFISTPGVLGKIYSDSVYYWGKALKKSQTISYTHLLPSKETLIYCSDSSFLIWGNKKNITFDHKHNFNRLYNIFNYKNQTYLTTDNGYYTLNHQSPHFTQAQLPITNRVVHYDSAQNAFWTRSGNFLMKEIYTNERHTIDTVMRDVEITQVLIDKDNNTWIATNGNGLYKYFVEDFNRCTPKSTYGVTAILKERDGANWIGTTNKGIRKINKGKISKYVFDEDIYRNNIRCITQSPKGVVWVGTGYGLGRYDNINDRFTWLTSNEGLSSSSISCVQFDDQDNVYIGTLGAGLNRYNGKTFNVYDTKSGLVGTSVFALHYSRINKCFFIGNEFGLQRLSGEKISSEPIAEIENTSVLSIHPYRDSLLLVGTGGGGVVIYNPRSKKKWRVTSKDGLVSDFIYFAASDNDGYVWVGTEKGISRIQFDHTMAIEKNLHYDHHNGLEGVETNQNAFYLGTNEKYFGLIDGLYEYTKNKSINDNTFPIHLTSVELLYGQYPIRKYARGVTGFFKIPEGLSLPSEKNHITFTFNRVDKQHPKSVKFKYWLVNFDKGWSAPSVGREAVYSNLPPGTYTFRVVSSDDMGSWLSDPLEYTFSIRAPFYQTIGFIVGVIAVLILCGLLMVYLRIRYKVNQAIAMERIREREQELLRKDIARDFHDEMGNQLSRIINYVSLLRLNGESSLSRSDLYAKVEESAKYLYSGTRDFIWSIDPVNDELSKLFIHLRDFGDKLFEEKVIGFRAYNTIKEKVTLHYGFSRQANLIFKEVMTNAFKYSNAKNVTLNLCRKADYFELSFEDDGEGFLMPELQKISGLKNMRERAIRIQGKLRIHSQPKQGTKVILEFKNYKSIKYGTTL